MQKKVKLMNEWQIATHSNDIHKRYYLYSQTLPSLQIQIFL